MGERNLIVGQSGGPSPVINSSLAGVIEASCGYAKVDRVFGMLNGIQGLLKGEIVDLGKEDSATIRSLRHTPAMALGSCRFKLTTREQHLAVLEILKKHDIHYFLYIGGNDSMHTTAVIGQVAFEEGYDLAVIGIPKTIDNDLKYVDHTPGFGSTARYEAITCADAVLDTISLRYVEHIKVIETMGRNAGWVTGASACAGLIRPELAPDLIYVPEVVFHKDSFLADVQNVYDRKGYCVIVACEGIKNPDGSLVAANTQPINVDAFGHPELGGVGQFLTELIMGELKLKTRMDKPGTFQRTARMFISSVDSEEAYEAGRRAVELAVSGTSGVMVTIEADRSGGGYRSNFGTVGLEDVAEGERLLPEGFLNAEKNNMTESFLKYVEPLLGEPLPDYAWLKKIPV